jgi:hypothetical protein
MPDAGQRAITAIPTYQHTNVIRIKKEPKTVSQKLTYDTKIENLYIKT